MVVSPPLLSAEALAYGYPGRTLGRGVDLSLAAGEVLCLLGPNGTGKTTLFKTLLGLLEPHGGRVRLGADDLSALSRPEVARRIAYVPQAHAAAFPFLVRDVVLMGRAAHLGPFGSPGAKDRDAADAALAELGISHLSARPYTDISGGERQLTLVARALAQQAPVLVLDEPTASLDFGNQVRVLSTLRALKASGRGIVLSTHDPAHAFLVADRVALLRDGALAALGPTAEVVTPDSLAALYRVRVGIGTLAGGEVAVVPRL